MTVATPIKPSSLSQKRKQTARWNVDIQYITDRHPEHVQMEELGDLQDHIELSGVDWHEMASINITLNRRVWPVGKPTDSKPGEEKV